MESIHVKQDTVFLSQQILFFLIHAFAYLMQTESFLEWYCDFIPHAVLLMDLNMLFNYFE